MKPKGKYLNTKASVFYDKATEGKELNHKVKFASGVYFDKFYFKKLKFLMKSF